MYIAFSVLLVCHVQFFTGVASIYGSYPYLELYALAIIDRSNMGVARLAGMGKDLELIAGARYSIVSCIYFIPYILLFALASSDVSIPI